MQILRDERLKPFNTLSLKATVEALVAVTSETDLQQALDWARGKGRTVVPLGQGSNVVISADLSGLVLLMQTRGIEVLRETRDSVLLRVAAGEDWHQLVNWSLEQGYFGLENLALIPGTAGAAPIQNIGAYGVELEAFIVQVHAVEIATGALVTLSREDCAFAYRNSIFKGAMRDKLVITHLELQLSLRPQVAIHYPALAQVFAGRKPGEISPWEVYESVVTIRSAKLPDPAREPNVGSFFKNPLVSEQCAQDLAKRFPGLPVYPQGSGQAKLPAAWLIEHCGWKGHRENGLGVHPQHALVLVNYGNDCGEDLLQLSRKISHSVNQQFGVDLEIEPRVYGA